MSKARGLADLGNVYDDGALSNRNLIINGAMQVAQRGTSFTGLTATQYCLDRMRFSVTNLGTWTVTQDSDAPEGFGSSMKVDCTTADASPASTDTLFLYHALEGQNLQALAKGTADAKPVTLSFWVKSSKTGASQVNMRDTDNTRVIGSSYSISSANTWEYKTVTFSGDTTGSLDNDNAKSLQLEWWLDAGATYTSGAIPTSWQAVSNGDLCVDNLSLGDSTSNTWQITGVQLEVGDGPATPFEHRRYSDELQSCMRYYQKSYDHDNYAGDADFDGAISQRSISNTGSNILSSALPTRMRAMPTVTLYGTTSATNTAGNIRGSGDVAISAVTGPSLSEARMDISFTSNQSNSYITAHYTADAEL